MGTVTLTPISAAEALGLSSREYLLVVGPDGSGKSCAIVSLAYLVTQMNPHATFWVIDTEFKFLTAWKSFGEHMPKNIQLFQCDTVQQAIDALDFIMKNRKANDWLAVESMARIWDKSQDMAYQAISGYDKSTYLQKRRELAAKGGGSAPPVPSPDNFWNIAKGAHDGDFLDKIDAATSLNVVMTSTVAKPPREGGKFKENETRKAARMEFGINLNIDGAPRLVYHAETTLITGYDPAHGMALTTWVVRDNKSAKAESRIAFVTPDKYSWAMNWWATCRA